MIILLFKKLIKRKMMSNNKVRMNRKDQMDFLRDFDLLTAIPQEQLSLYAAADLQIGRHQMKSSYVIQQDKIEHKQNDKNIDKYKLSCNISQFKKYGPGIYLLFLLLKYLTIIFAFMSLLAISSTFILYFDDQAQKTFTNNQLKEIILKCTLFNLNQKDYNLYTGIHYSIACLFAIFLIYWSEKEKDIVYQCLQITPLSSYSTIILKDLPKNYREHDLQDLLSKNFGQIAEIYSVRDFGDDMLYYKTINQIVQQYKEQLMITKLDQNKKSDIISNLFLEFRSSHIKLKQKIKNNQNYQPVFVFVRFRLVQDKESFMEAHIQKNTLPCLYDVKSRKNEVKEDKNMQDGINTNKKIKQDNEKLVDHSLEEKLRLDQLNFVQCQMEPGGILWQNIHVKSSQVAIKTTFLILLMVVLLLMGITFIFLLSVIQMSLQNSKFKHYTKEQIINLNDKYALLSYCVNLSFSQYYHEFDFCKDYNSEFIKLTIMIFLIPISISIFKLILTDIMKTLVSFRRYAYEIDKIKSQFSIIFFFYFTITGVLQLLIYLGSQQISTIGIFTPLIKSLVNTSFETSKISIESDFTPGWYLVASSNILLIGAISFNLSGIGIIAYCKLRQRIYSYFAKKQLIQIRMNRWLQGYSLQIQYIYAAILTIIYFTMLFGGSMPLLYFFAFISFFIMFWSHKYIFINFCAKPLKYNHYINKLVRKIMVGALIIHSFFTPIFYRAQKIGDIRLNENIIRRIIFQWRYILLICLVAVYLLLNESIKQLIIKIKQKIANMKQNRQSHNQQPKLFRKKRNYTLPTVVRKKLNEVTLESYSMHESIRYKNILRSLYTINNRQRTRKTCILNKELFHLYEDSIKTDNDEMQFRTLIEVLAAVNKDYQFEVELEGRKGKKNSYFKIKKKLCQIYQHSKRYQNRSYTLFADPGSTISSNFSSSSQGDNGCQEKKNQQFLSSQNSENQTKTKFQLLSTYPANLQQVIQASQSLQDEGDNKSCHDSNPKPKEDKSSSKKLPFKKKYIQVQIPLESAKRMNNSEL